MDYRFLRFPKGRYKAVTLSYDDGNINDNKLMEIINRYGMKCTLNLNNQRLITGNDLTVEQARELLAQGHEVAVHGAQHLASGLVSPVNGIRDVLDNREFLEETFGCIIRGMAYPDSGIRRFTNGSDYETVRSYLKALGIAYSRTLGSDNDLFELPSDWFAWMPTAHHINPELFKYIDKFLELDISKRYRSQHYPRLFYLWGHSYEFENNKNWELLEEICQKLGGKEDIWYATNIKIYDYVNAYYSLVWSADGRRVYNPTLIPVWFASGNDVYCVNSGETILVK